MTHHLNEVFLVVLSRSILPVWETKRENLCAVVVIRPWTPLDPRVRSCGIHLGMKVHLQRKCLTYSVACLCAEELLKESVRDRFLFLCVSLMSRGAPVRRRGCGRLHHIKVMFV